MLSMLHKGIFTVEINVKIRMVTFILQMKMGRREEEREDDMEAWSTKHKESS